MTTTTVKTYRVIEDPGHDTTADGADRMAALCEYLAWRCDDSDRCEIEEIRAGEYRVRYPGTSAPVTVRVEDA